MVVSFVALSIALWLGLSGEGGILKWSPAYTIDEATSSSSSFATKVEASDDDDSGR